MLTGFMLTGFMVFGFMVFGFIVFVSSIAANEAFHLRLLRQNLMPRFPVSTPKRPDCFYPYSTSSLQILLKNSKSVFFFFLFVVHV